MLALGCPQGGARNSGCTCAPEGLERGCEVLGQPYVFQKQWWGPPQGLERLSRAGLSQNPHLLYYYTKDNLLKPDKMTI